MFQEELLFSRVLALLLRALPLSALAFFLTGALYNPRLLLKPLAQTLLFFSFFSLSFHA